MRQLEMKSLLESQEDAKKGKLMNGRGQVVGDVPVSIFSPSPGAGGACRLHRQVLSSQRLRAECAANCQTAQWFKRELD